jgi:hypothetical protein
MCEMNDKEGGEESRQPKHEECEVKHWGQEKAEGQDRRCKCAVFAVVVLWVLFCFIKTVLLFLGFWGGFTIC